MEMINEVSFLFPLSLEAVFLFIFGGDQSNDLVVFTGQSFIAIGAFHDRHAFLNFFSYSP